MSDDVEAALLIADAATPKTHGSILVENLAVLASEVRRLTAAARMLASEVRCLTAEQAGEVRALLPDGMRDQLERLAERDSITIGTVIRDALRAHFRAEGVPE